MTSNPDGDNDTLSENEAQLGALTGALLAYYIISGTVVLFLILRPLRIIQPILIALGEFRVVGLVILAVVALFVNVAAFSLLIINAEAAKQLFE